MLLTRFVLPIDTTPIMYGGFAQAFTLIHTPIYFYTATGERLDQVRIGDYGAVDSNVYWYDQRAIIEIYDRYNNLVASIDHTPDANNVVSYQADWGETDVNSPAFIRNKPLYTDVQIEPFVSPNVVNTTSGLDTPVNSSVSGISTRAQVAGNNSWYAVLTSGSWTRNMTVWKFSLVLSFRRSDGSTGSFATRTRVIVPPMNEYNHWQQINGTISAPWGGKYASAYSTLIASIGIDYYPSATPVVYVAPIPCDVNGNLYINAPTVNATVYTIGLYVVVYNNSYSANPSAVTDFTIESSQWIIVDKIVGRIRN